MLIDTHAHLNFFAYKDDAEEVAKRALERDIWIINVGSQYSTSQRAVKMAEKYEKGMYAAIGLHPIHLSELVFKDKVDNSEEVEFHPSVEEFDEKKYFDLAQSKKVVAVGEIGLDYFHNKNNKEKQKEVFIKQIELAVKLNLPIIIHCREAHGDILEILKDKNKQCGDRLRGVVHCFSGRVSQAKEYIKLGFFLGFNGIITFARDYDKVLKEIGLERFLLETDCPYLTPIPYRGKRNEPAYARYVAGKIAQIKEKSINEIEEITTKNARKLFGM